MNISGLFNNSLRLLFDENSISRVNGLAGKGLNGWINRWSLEKHAASKWGGFIIQRWILITDGLMPCNKGDLWSGGGFILQGWHWSGVGLT